MAFYMMANGCAEELLPDSQVAGSTPFGADMVIGSERVDFSDPNYIMVPSFVMTNDGYEYSGTYLEAGCTDQCMPSLKISFLDQSANRRDNIHIDDVIYDGTYNYETSTSAAPSFLDQFEAILSGENSPERVCWSDGTSEVLCDPFLLADTSFVPTSVITEYADGSRFEYFSAFMDQADVDVPTAEAGQFPKLVVEQSDDQEFFIVRIADGDEIRTISWHVLSTNETIEAKEIKLTSKELSDPVNVEIVSGSQQTMGRITRISMELDANRFNGTKCVEGFFINTDALFDAVGNQQVSTQIEFMKNGTLYTSFGADRQSFERFEVYNVRDFEFTPDGFPTKIFDVVFSVVLSNPDTGESIEVRDAAATFAIAYPG